eukprot:TRINITY_DN28395_c0_g1_i1.p1 TRINITY_DN28395_c0_g1~~TRINITY_DN28395_c0_g1_i1.p1  ORF type:complete len:1153 (-),score=296.84 TRINITY_DN28395_c0_g1_i1:63-3521(-)
MGLGGRILARVCPLIIWSQLLDCGGPAWAISSGPADADPSEVSQLLEPGLRPHHAAGAPPRQAWRKKGRKSGGRHARAKGANLEVEVSGRGSLLELKNKVGVLDGWRQDQAEEDEKESAAGGGEAAFQERHAARDDEGDEGVDATSHAEERAVHAGGREGSDEVALEERGRNDEGLEALLGGLEDQLLRQGALDNDEKELQHAEEALKLLDEDLLAESPRTKTHSEGALERLERAAANFTEAGADVEEEAAVADDDNAESLIAARQAAEASHEAGEASEEEGPGIIDGGGDGTVVTTAVGGEAAKGALLDVDWIGRAAKAAQAPAVDYAASQRRLDQEAAELLVEIHRRESRPKPELPPWNPPAEPPAATGLAGLKKYVERKRGAQSKDDGFSLLAETEHDETQFLADMALEGSLIELQGRQRSRGEVRALEEALQAKKKSTTSSVQDLTPPSIVGQESKKCVIDHAISSECLPLGTAALEQVQEDLSLEKGLALVDEQVWSMTPAMIRESSASRPGLIADLWPLLTQPQQRELSRELDCGHVFDLVYKTLCQIADEPLLAMQTKCQQGASPEEIKQALDETQDFEECKYCQAMQEHGGCQRPDWEAPEDEWQLLGVTGDWGDGKADPGFTGEVMKHMVDASTTWILRRDCMLCIGEFRQFYIKLANLEGPWPVGMTYPPSGWKVASLWATWKHAFEVYSSLQDAKENKNQWSKCSVPKEVFGVPMPGVGVTTCRRFNSETTFGSLEERLKREPQFASTTGDYVGKGQPFVRWFMMKGAPEEDLVALANISMQCRAIYNARLVSGAEGLWTPSKVNTISNGLNRRSHGFGHWRMVRKDSWAEEESSLTEEKPGPTKPAPKKPAPKKPAPSWSPPRRRRSGGAQENQPSEKQPSRLELELDLGSQHLPYAAFTLQFDSNAKPRSYEITRSNDGKAWTFVYNSTQSLLGKKMSHWHEHHVASSGQAVTDRYIRIAMEDGSCFSKKVNNYYKCFTIYGLRPSRCQEASSLKSTDEDEEEEEEDEEEEEEESSTATPSGSLIEEDVVTPLGRTTEHRGDKGRWYDTPATRIQYQAQNPYIGTAGYVRYERYKQSGTIAEAREAGATTEDFLRDLDHGYMRILQGAAAPPRQAAGHHTSKSRSLFRKDDAPDTVHVF